MIRYPDKTDIALCLEWQDPFGSALNPSVPDWEIRLWTRGKKVLLRHVAGENGAESLGDIPAAARMEVGKLHLYIQSSTVPFGEGRLCLSLRLDTPDTNFPDGHRVTGLLPALCIRPWKSGPWELKTDLVIF